MDRKVEMDRAFAELTERLIKRFGHQVAREVIEETVTVCGAPFRKARIVDFVPVLTERSCVARLRALADGAAQHEVSTQQREASRQRQARRRGL
ncbi:MAG: three-helix bundle dimerization domain-containing protein [Acidimicrobiales bacterium]